jgi:hypothetical protein
MFDALPPKYEMFSNVHWRAARWSQKPALGAKEDEMRVEEARKPKMLRR